MKRSRFSEEQLLGLREAETGSPVKAVCAAHNLSAATYHGWKRKYGGMEVSKAKMYWFVHIKKRVIEHCNLRNERTKSENDA